MPSKIAEFLALKPDQNIHALSLSALKGMGITYINNAAQNRGIGASIIPETLRLGGGQSVGLDIEAQGQRYHIELPICVDDDGAMRFVNHQERFWLALDISLPFGVYRDKHREFVVDAWGVIRPREKIAHNFFVFLDELNHCMGLDAHQCSFDASLICAAGDFLGEIFTLILGLYTHRINKLSERSYVLFNLIKNQLKSRELIYVPKEYNELTILSIMQGISYKSLRRVLPLVDQGWQDEFKATLNVYDSNPTKMKRRSIFHFNMRYSSISDYIPLHKYNTPARIKIGVNALKQALPLPWGDRPTVCSQDDGWMSQTIGKNMLTAWMHWFGYTTDDSIVISRQALRQCKLTARFRDAPVVYPEVGDKMSNRYGHKGVIGQIIPDYMTPQLPNGDRVDVISAPESVMARNNFGALIESALGFCGWVNGRRYRLSPHQFIDMDALRAECALSFIRLIQQELRAELIAAPLRRFVAAYLERGRSQPEILIEDKAMAAQLIDTAEQLASDYRGESRWAERCVCPCALKFRLYLPHLRRLTEDGVFVGVTFWVRTYHLAKRAARYRISGMYSPYTLQPTQNAQRFGEMEVWALQAHGQDDVVDYLLYRCSDDIVAKSLKGAHSGHHSFTQEQALNRLKALGIGVMFTDSD
jgi:hypothetical protein